MDKFVEDLYAGDPYFTPDKALNSDIPIRYFTVQDKGKIYGRAAAIINDEINYQNYKVGLIGFYECVDDADVARKLFSQVDNYLRSQNCTYCIGPLNGDTWHKYRLTDPGAEAPFFLDNYHKPYYAQQFITNDFNSIASYHSARITDLTISEKRIAKFERIFDNKGITIRPINRQNFTEEIKKIHAICCVAFKDNFLYTPISQQEVLNMYGQIKTIVNPDFVLICEDGSDPVGFIFCVPNFYEKQKKALLIKTAAVMPASRYKGLGVLLAYKIHHMALAKGYDEVIYALMHDSNISAKTAAHKGAVFRTYQLYGKEL
ncbi:MAG: GNAT family N-acetyltransferase [Gammaproteobacteria bacterium]|nr:GNAT family N-acetyltransferase [Gammaproteobacteria bacterium]